VLMFVLVLARSVRVVLYIIAFLVTTLMCINSFESHGKKLNSRNIIDPPNVA